MIDINFGTRKKVIYDEEYQVECLAFQNCIDKEQLERIRGFDCKQNLD